MTAWQDQPPLRRRQAREKQSGDVDESAPAEQGAVGEDTLRRSAGRRAQLEQTAETATAEQRVPLLVGREGVDPAPEGNPGYRVRDYSPDIRRAVFTPPAPQPSTLAVPEFTMTRRALRELRQRAEAAGQEAPSLVRDVDGSLALTGSIAVIDLPRTADGHVAEEPFVGETIVAAYAADAGTALGAAADPVPPVAQQATDVPGYDRIPVEVIVAEQALAAAMIDDATVIEATIIDVPVEVARVVEVEVDGDTVISPARPGADTPPLPEHHGGRGVEPAPDAAPHGHWSARVALDDAGRSTTSRLTRNGGNPTGAITTHALVLPSAPSLTDHLLNPVTATGEIMVTGSIDLPRSFGSTGAHPALFDHPDVDALIDESDREDAVSESAPVRAIRAVSSNYSTRGVIEAPGQRKSRLPVIAGITGGSALLVAVGVVVAGFIFNAF